MAKKDNVICPECGVGEMHKGSVWCPNCYFKFATEHHVFGTAAIDLKKKMEIPEPKVKLTKRKHIT